MAGLAAKSTLLALALVALNLGGIAALKQPKKSMEDKFHHLDGFKRLGKPKIQHDFTVEIESVQTTNTPGGFLGPETILFSTLFNDTTRVGAAFIYLIADMPADTMMSYNLYSYDNSNQWKLYMKKTEEVCEFMGEQKFIFKKFQENGNITGECPMTAGNYFFDKFTVDTTPFPLELEETRWRMDYRLFSKNTEETYLTFNYIVWARQVDDEE